MYRNGLCSLICLLLPVLFLSCGGGEKETLILLHSLGQDSSSADYRMLGRYMQTFSSEYDSATVKLQYKPFRDAEVIARNPDKLDPSEYPDMMLLPHDQIAMLAEKKLIVPIDDYINSRKNKFESVALQASYYKGHAYGLPVHGESLLLVYNRDFVKKPPADVNGLFTLKRKLEPRRVQHTLVYTWAIPYFALPWVFAYGGRIFDDTGYPRVNEPRTVQAIARYADLVINRLGIPFAKSTAYYRNAFLKKRAALFMTGPWMFSKIRENRINYGMALLPRLETGKPVTPFVGYKILVVFRQPKKERLKMIRDFFDYLMKSGFYADYCLVSQKTPSLRSAYNDPRIRANPLIRLARSQQKNGIPMPNSLGMNLIWSYLNEDVFYRVMKSPARKVLLDRVQNLIDRRARELKLVP